MLLASLALAGCSFDGSSLEARRCNQDSECAVDGEGYTCVNGYCQWEEVETCASDAQCDDGAFCNGAETCAPSDPLADDLGCVAGQAPALSDSIPCTEDRCDEDSDQVIHDNSTCDCATAGEVCPGESPACTRLVCNDLLQCESEQLGQGVACDDGVPCTQDDVCDGAGTCRGTLSDDVCSDGLFCNGDEACDPGALDANEQGCVPGEPPELADDLECTTDLCNEDEDRVIHDEGTCECQVPNTICEGMEAPACMRWVCSAELTCELLPQNAGAPCDDGFACTNNDFCNAEGQCRGSANHVFCSDSLFCTGEEACLPTSPLANLDGCVQGTPPVVDDGLRCTEDRCDEANDQVTHEAIPNCEELVCQQDSDCLPEQGANPCLDYVCGPGQACTTQFKAAGESCDDGVACTDTDQCNGQGTCQGRANNTLCDDDAFCNGAEICNPIDQRADANGCLAGQAPSLEDGVACTEDVCDEGTDQVLHTPTEACECQADGDCEQTCEIAVCDRSTWTCDNRPAPAGTPCEDGDMCTLGETCDANQVCGGGAAGGCDCVQDSDCPLSACQVSASCNAGTCVYENADMGTPCGEGVACDQSACNSEGACVPSLNDAACDSPGECRQGGSCQPGAQGADGEGCVYDLAPAQTPCGSGVACDQSACNDAGVCVPELNDALCQVACRVDGACDPDGQGADAQGCVAGSLAQDGEACLLSCGQEEVAGSCQSGSCALAPEGPSAPGRDLCGDNLDNDCDGDVDEDDSDCKVPDQVMVVAPEVATVGLEGPGAAVTVMTYADNQPVTEQSRNLYCQARPVLWSRDFNDSGDLDSGVPASNNQTANKVYVVQGDSDSEVDSYGDNVAMGVALEDGAMGAKVCNGYGLRIDPGVNMSTLEAGRSFMVSVRMKNPEVGGLGEGQFAVLSYRTRNGTGGAYVPLVAIGDGLDRAQRSYEFAFYPLSSGGPFSMRLDVASSTGVFSGDHCVQVDQVQVFAIPRPPLAVSDNGRRQMMRWTWGAQERDAQVLFNTTGDQDNVNTDMLLGQFFSQRLPVEGHDLALSTDGTPFSNSSGVTWAYTGNFPGASVSFPPALPPAGVLGEGAVQATRDSYRVNPLMMDFAMAVDNGQWSSGDLAHLSLALPGAELDLNALRRLASALPRDGADPVGWVSHYDVNLPSQNRFYAVLPEEARPLAQRSLALAHGNLEGQGARVLLDDVSLYSFLPVTAEDVRASVGSPTGFGEPSYSATIHSAREGQVQVRCYWQDLDDPMTVTRASEPVNINFTSNQ